VVRYSQHDFALLMDIRYRVYPSLLNLYARYEAGLVEEQTLLDRLNRVPVPQTAAQARGVSFEEAVIKGTQAEQFDATILQKVRRMLPRPLVATQQYCQYQYEHVLIYGYVDVLGMGLAVDLKTTTRYQPGRYQHDHQHFYLRALQSRGIRRLRYVITDFREVYQEEYDFRTDLSVQEAQLLRFCDFLDTHRGAITDKRLFGTD
jgi:hypothetical protein